MSEIRVHVTANTDSDRSGWTDRLTARVCQLAGGATVYTGQRGYWINPDTGSLASEPVNVILSYCDNPRAVYDAILPDIARYVLACNQEAALIALDGAPIFLSQDDCLNLLEAQNDR